VSVKAIVMGVMGVGGVGAATYMGVGGGGPNDFIGHVNKSPQAVYAAFSAIGQEGEISVPGQRGWGSRVKQRITKVANEEVKIEVEIDGRTLISAEIEVSPDGNGTRLAAELDFDKAAMNKLLAEAGGAEVPEFAMEEYMLDAMFAAAMRDAVERIEEGKPLLSLSETRSRWGSSPRSARPSTSVSGDRPRGERARPQMDTRPAIDPNAAARQHVGESRGSFD
jgi:hypothetical protein